MKKKFLLSFCLLSLLLCTLCVLCACDKKKTLPAKKGMVPPDPGALYLADDQPVRFNKYLGKPLVVLFFSNSCCADELEKLETIAENQQELLQMLGVNVGDSLEEVARLGKEKRVSFPLAYDPLLTSKHRFRLMAIPTVFIIDKEGKIAGRIIGKVSFDQLQSKILATIKGGQ